MQGRVPKRTGIDMISNGINVDNKFDGDQLSANSIQAKDSIDEIEDLFTKRIFYISGAGDFLYDPVQEPHEFLLRALTNGH